MLVDDGAGSLVCNCDATDTGQLALRETVNHRSTGNGSLMVTPGTRTLGETPETYVLSTRSQGTESLRVVSVSYELLHDDVSQEFILAGRVLRLAPQEYRLLRFFAGHPGYLLTHRQLLEAVWPDALESERNALHTSICRLRIHLQPVGSRLIQTRARSGYRFVPEPD